MAAVAPPRVWTVRPAGPDGAAGAVAGTLAVVATATTLLVVAVGREAEAVGYRLEQALPAPLLVACALVSVGAATVPWMLLGGDSARPVWLALALIAAQVPVWSGWELLSAPVRALALAPTLLVAPAVARALTGGRLTRVALIAGTGGTVLHAASFDPFRELDCEGLRSCLAASPLLTGRVAQAALVVAAVLALGAAVVALLAIATARVRLPLRVTAAAAVLMSAGVVLSGRGAVEVRGLVLPSDFLLALSTAAVAITIGLDELRLRRTRRSVDRLIRHLEEGRDPAKIPDVSVLAPGQRLALESALLTAEARRTLKETRALQRRTQQRADDEQERIERDLHDGAQQLLVGAAIQLGVVAGTDSTRGTGDIEAARQRILDALEALRTIAHGQFPRTLVDEGLTAALEDLCLDRASFLEVDAGFADPSDVQVCRAAYAVVDALTEETVERIKLGFGDGAVVVTVEGPSGELPLAVLDRLRSVGGEIMAYETGIEVVLPCES